MEPILAAERAHEVNGLWTTQKYGDFVQGDKRLAPAFVTGRVEMRQLRGLFKLSFSQLNVVRRRVDDGPKRSLRAKVFLTRKKTKKRMADLEETGYNVPVSADVDAGGFVCVGKTSLGSFDVTLRDAPEDPLLYRGLCIAKAAHDPPLTEEPAIYGFVRFIDDRPEMSTTENALGLHENRDLMRKMYKCGDSKYKPIQVYTRAVFMQSTIIVWSKNALESRLQARKAWEEMELVEEQQIKFDQFKRGLDLLDITVLEPRAMRLFQATDLSRSGQIGITEFQVALMMNDGAPDHGLTTIDAFHMFDLDHSGVLTKSAFSRVIAALGLGKSQQGKTEDSEERKVAIDALFDRIDRRKTGKMSYSEFKAAWTRLVDVDAELCARKKKPRRLPKVLRMFNFLKAGPDMINRATLLAFCDEDEIEERRSFQRAREHVDRLRVEARTRRDERRRARQTERERLSLSAAKDSALRNKDRAARLVQEQRLRNKQRAEEKLMKSRLEAEQAAAKRRHEAVLKAESKKREADRIAVIRFRGADRLDLSGRSIRVLPVELYVGRDAQEALSDLVMIDIGENGLESLPTGFLMWFASLRYLRLTANRLIHLPVDELGKMGRLEVLKLNANDLETIPNSIGELRVLRELDLCTNRLSELPGAIGQMRSIEYVNASSNQLNSLPDLSGLQILRDLQMRGNNLFELPDSLPNLISLTRLDVRNNRIHKLPQGIGKLGKLRFLDVSSNQIVTLPDGASGLLGCEVFNLSENKLSHLGSWIRGWKRASFVDVTDNKVEYVDRAVGFLQDLTELRLKKNRIAHLPPEIGLVQALEVLDVSANVLQRLPVELGALALLHTLILSRNSLSGNLPEQIGLLRSVTYLDLSQNSVESLPDSIGGLGELVKFDLSHNRLSSMPEAISECARLHELFLSSNRIKQLPMHLGKCASLRVLELQSNIITEIPANLAYLINLKSINLGKNLLRALPLDIANLCETVDELHFDRNPFSDFPPRWAKFIGRSAFERSLWPSGYDDSMAIAWVKDHAAFYGAAVAEWELAGPLYVSGRSNLAAYEAAVKRRCGPAWQPHLCSLLRAYYFKTKRSGNCPKFNRLTDAETQYRVRTRRRAFSVRDVRYRDACGAAAEYEAIFDEIYSGRLLTRTNKSKICGQVRKRKVTILASREENMFIADSGRRKLYQNSQLLRIKLKQKRQERLEIEELHQHLWESCGRPADGKHFFPRSN